MKKIIPILIILSFIPAISFAKSRINDRYPRTTHAWPLRSAKRVCVPNPYKVNLSKYVLRDGKYYPKDDMDPSLQADEDTKKYE